jgi:hypothetical protein
MARVYTGSVLGVRVLAPDELAQTREELAWLEQDLIRRRKKLAFWARCKARVEAEPDMKASMREGALYFHDQALKLVASGEKLRAYLVVELQDQPDFQPAYHHAH